MFRLFFRRHRTVLLSGILLPVAAALLLWNRECGHAVREGLALCADVVLPSLFPFFILSSLVVELGLSHCLGRILSPVMKPLFRVNGCCASALVLGLVGGYPVGARTAAALYENGQCSKTEAERLLAFCNNCGPAFILGMAGSGLLGGAGIGALLYAVHVLSALLVGLLFRFYKYRDKPGCRAAAIPLQAAPFAPAFVRAVTGAATSALNVCAFILCFGVLQRILSLSGILTSTSAVLSRLFGPLGLSREGICQLLTGLLELSSGIASLNGGTASGRLVPAAFLLGWGGLSVHCQVLAFVGSRGLSLRPYFVGKLLHAILAAALTAVLACSLCPAADCLAEQGITASAGGFPYALVLSFLYAWGMALLFLLAAAAPRKKRSGKSNRHAL